MSYRHRTKRRSRRAAHFGAEVALVKPTALTNGNTSRLVHSRRILNERDLSTDPSNSSHIA
jgi:hypothetical protein